MYKVGKVETDISAIIFNEVDKQSVLVSHTSTVSSLRHYRSSRKLLLRQTQEKNFIPIFE